jgi:hypothetical protein
MRQDNDYWEAYRRWLELKPVYIDAEHRLTRAEAHERTTANTSDGSLPPLDRFPAE